MTTDFNEWHGRFDSRQGGYDFAIEAIHRAAEIEGGVLNEPRAKQTSSPTSD